MNPNAFEEIIAHRRSVRIFDPTPVPESIIEKCLDQALLAPNSSNLQPWEFHWVRSEPKRKQLVEACLSQAAAATAAELIVCVARTDTWKSARLDMIKQMTEAQSAGARIPEAAWMYYQKLVPIMYGQGWFSLIGAAKQVAFFLIGLRKPMMREPTSHADLRNWAIKSTALGCENLMLAATAYGYDSCPMEGIDSRRIRKLLKLSSRSVIVMVIAIGKRAPNGVTLPRIRGDRKRYVIRH
jgi:nitroreductase